MRKRPSVIYSETKVRARESQRSDRTRQWS